MTVPQGGTANARIKPPVVPGFVWERLLGTGGLAQVHLYQQQVPVRPVAIKVPHPMNNPAIWPELIREADAMSAVAGHPAVLTLYLVGVMPSGCPYLVLEYCPTNNLGAQAREHPMAVAAVLDMMVRICGGAEMLHRAGFVHGDIKPSNIMVTAYGKPVLADFGLATRAGESPPGARFSSLWAPPEQQLGNASTHPVWDVWSLAATAWTLLAGRSPFEDPGGDNSISQVAARARSGRRAGLARPDVPETLLRVLENALAVDPAARTASAAEFGRGLQQVQQALRLPVTPMEVQDGPATVVVEGLVDANRTVMRGVTQLAPAPSFSGSTAIDAPVEADRPLVHDDDHVPSRTRSPLARIILWTGLAVVVCAAIVTAVLFGSGAVIQPPPIHQTGQPVDPLGGIPDPVAELRHTVADGTVTWSWTHADAAGMTYQYTITSDGADVTSKGTPDKVASTKAQPGHVLCIEVVAVSAEGRQSAAKNDCAPAPGGTPSG